MNCLVVADTGDRKGKRVMRNIMLWCTNGPHLTRPHSMDERGASVIEYALLLALIVVVCIGAMVLIGDTTDTSLSRTGTSLLG